MRKKINPVFLLANEVLLLAAALGWIWFFDSSGVRDRDGQMLLPAFVQKLTPHVTHILLGAVLGVAIAYLDLYALRRLLPLPAGEESEFRGMSIPVVLLVALATGLCEEVLFRGVMQPMFGIWVTSFLFGLCHPTSWQRALHCALFGLVMGCAVMFFGSLWVPIMAHIFNNLVELYKLRK